jgi:hypothetical protein
MTNGQLGEVPEGYTEAKAALYWGVDPNKIIHWPIYWVELGFIINEAESNVRKYKEEKAAKKARTGHGRQRRR